jgi:predicted GNAT family acetyltransferase
MTSKDWQEVFDQGFRYCGIVQSGAIVALAAVWTYSSEAWELAAVQTDEAWRGRGYAKAVCSFVTAHILANGRVATCGTGADNIAMQRVAAAIGFRPMPEG